MGPPAGSDEQNLFTLVLLALAPTVCSTGSEFKIALESDSSTGFHWAWVEKLDEAVLPFVSNEFKGVETPMPGSGGLEISAFKSVSAGEAKITLGYNSPSNEPTGPQQTAAFTVTVM